MMKNKILIAIDLDDDYLYVIKKGLELAHLMNAKVILASIVNIYVNYIQPDIATSPIQWDDIYNSQIEYTVQELEKIKMRNKLIQKMLIIWSWEHMVAQVYHMYLWVALRNTLLDMQPNQFW